MRAALKLARTDSVRIVVPTVVVGEWWRGRIKTRELLIEPVQLEPLNESLAKLAGEALAKIRRASFADAVVMASAAQRGDLSCTRPIRGDLDCLWPHFAAVRRILPAT